MQHTPGTAWLVFGLTSTVLCLSACPAEDDVASAADGGVNDGGSEAVKGPLPPDSDESCDIKSGYEGDDLCLLPPKKGTGMQVHLGPKSYDAKAVEPFLLGPQQEVTECYFIKTPNDKIEFYFPRKIRQRPGSHHLIAYMVDADMPDGWGPCERTNLLGSLGGAEKTKVDYPTGNVVAPENAKIGRTIIPHVQMKIEWHHVNTTDKPILREAWINVYWKPKAEIERYMQDMFMIGGMQHVPPGETQIMHYTCPVKADTRIVDVFGHFHSHTKRFSAWHVQGGKKNLFYEVYDWHDTPTVAYDTLTDNDTPDRDLLRPGGHTGLLELKQGDTVEWECEIQNDTLKELAWGNYVHTAEMCNLFGTYDSNDAALFMCRGMPTVTTISKK